MTHSLFHISTVTRASYPRRHTRVLGTHWRRILAALALTAITISGAAFLPSRAHSDAAPGLSAASHLAASAGYLSPRLTPR